jgi:hypothetical protein
MLFAVSLSYTTSLIQDYRIFHRSDEHSDCTAVMTLQNTENFIYHLV